MTDASTNGEKCTCQEYVNTDPANKPPTDRLKFLHYLKHGPAQPEKIVSTGGRTFQTSWYLKFPWLEYSQSKSAAYCFYCRLFATNIPSSKQVRPGGHLDESFTKTGFRNWKKALEKGKGFYQHCESRGHTDAEKAYQNYLKSKPVDEQLSDENARQVAQRSKAVKRNRLILTRLFSLVRLLGRLALPFRGHDETSASSNEGVYREVVEYLASKGDDVLNYHLENSPKNATYLSPESQNEMINIVGSSIIDEVVGRVKAAGFYNFMMDGTPDCSHKEQCSVFVRYLYNLDEKPTIEERLLGIVTARESTGEALTNILLGLLKKRGLNIVDAVGQGYDGGANMSGDKKGVQARVREINPTCLFVKCFDHDLNRAVVSTINSSDNHIARNFFVVVELLITFVESSASRFEKFVNLQKNDGNKALKPMKLSDTRWSCRALSLERYNNPVVLRAAIGTVQHVIETTTDNLALGTAVGLNANVQKNIFFLALVALAPVFSVINQVNEFLQSPAVDIMEADTKISCLKKELQDLRNDCQWTKIVQEAEIKMKEVLSVEEIETIQSSRVRFRKVPRRIDENPETQHVSLTESDSLRVQFYYLTLDKIMSELNTRFPAKLRKFASLYSKYMGNIDAENNVRELANQYCSIDSDRAVTQWRLFRHESPHDLPLVEVYSKVPSSYNDLKKLYQIFLTLPVTTASNERGFSKLTLVKTKIRSTMTDPRLESLLLTSIERDLVQSLNDTNLVDKFASVADPRSDHFIKR